MKNNELYEKAMELAMLLSQLNNDELNKVHGILIGMNIAKEAKNTA